MSTALPLHRLLQRHAAGAGGDHLLEDLLRSEAGRLAAEDHGLDTCRPELRRLAGPHLEAFHQGLFGAVARLDALDFAAASEHIRRSDAALRELRRVQRSLQELREVEGFWEGLRHELSLDPLSELPMLRIPRRLLDLSQDFVETGRPRESLVTSRLCRRLLDRLAARGEAGGRKLSTRLAALRRDLAEAGAPDLERLAEVDRLAGSGHGELASRLADDLETELLGWRAQSRRGERPAAALAREIAEVARLANSLQQTLKHWLPANPIEQPRKEG